ncbi:MAG: sigma-70 family RNA polymerase sigma factor [Lentisphaeraceae bacterium]|nr:sigma-70 family RNA polymerase sigma factor [Lentisphaeraceae bacterium]
MNKDPYLTRQTLLKRAQDPHGHRAWEDFVAYYESFIHMVLKRISYNQQDHDDLVQEILLKLWDNLKSYEPERSKFRTWLSTVIRNTFINFLDKKSRQTKRDSSSQDPEIHDLIYSKTGSELEQLIQQEWEIYAANLAMERVRPLFSDTAMNVFNMLLDRKSVHEISSTLDLPESNIYKMKKRVKERLGKEIKLIRQELEF